MAEEISFRLAGRTDAASLSQFSCADKGQRHTRDVEELIRTDVAEDLAAGNSELRVVLALRADVIVGVIAHSLVDLDHEGDVHYIHALGVHPDFRRRLIGTILKQNVLDYAHETGIERVASQVHRRNHPMLALNNELNAVTSPDPDDGDYLLTVTRAESVLAGVVDDPNHYGDSGPVAAVDRLLDAIIDDRFDDVWNLLDTTMQLCRAQAWLWNNRTVLVDEGIGTHIELLPDLLDGPSTVPLWVEFAASERNQLVDVWSEWLDLHQAGALGAGSRTRLAGPGYERLIFMEAPKVPTVFTEPTEVHALQLTVHYEMDSWKVASYGSEVPTPGWPPSIVE